MAWVEYKKTWEDGLRGVPSEDTTTLPVKANNDDESIINATKVGENVSQNLDEAQKDAKELLERAKERTGIHTQEDLRKFASDMMQLATECLKEFMAGYRKGRDEEVDKMLHEYFQDLEQDNVNNNEEGAPSKRRRRRKTKRADLRV